MSLKLLKMILQLGISAKISKHRYSNRQEFSLKINKRVGSDKACRWEKFLKKDKICCVLIRGFRVCILHNQLKIILFYQYIEHAHHQSLIAKLLVVQIQITRNAQVHVYQKVGSTMEEKNVLMVQMKALQVCMKIIFILDSIWNQILDQSYSILLNNRTGTVIV